MRARARRTAFVTISPRSFYSLLFFAARRYGGVKENSRNGKTKPRTIVMQCRRIVTNSENGITRLQRRDVNTGQVGRGRMILISNSCII